MGTNIEHWQPIDTLPIEQGPFRFRWPDGEVREMGGYEPERWSEDGHREDRPTEWAPVGAQVSSFLPSAFRVNIQGWDSADEDEARTFGQNVFGFTAAFAEHLDLSRLDEVIIAYDYPAALAGVQKGAGQGPSEATSNEFGHGGAMAVPIFRDGQARNVVVIWTPLVREMFGDASSAETAKARHTFFHELIHVDDLAFLDRTFPGGAMATKERDPRHGAQLSISCPAYAEYSASRQSASVHPEAGFEFIDMLEATIKDALTDVVGERRLYRFHGDLDRFWGWASERARFVFQALGYALGHADWVAERCEDASLKQRYEQALRRVTDMELGWLVDATRAAILPIYNQSAWESLDIYDDLNSVAERLLNQFGLFTSMRSGSLYINIPMKGFFD